LYRAFIAFPTFAARGARFFRVSSTFFDILLLALATETFSKAPILAGLEGKGGIGPW
jgi:hypothetical protein